MPKFVWPRMAASNMPIKNLPAVEDWDVNPNSAFVHFAINETVNGLQYQNVPKLSDGLPPLVCDMSSEIFVA